MLIRMGAMRCWRCGEPFVGQVVCSQGSSAAYRYCEPSGQPPIAFAIKAVVHQVAPAGALETPRAYCDRNGIAVPEPSRGEGQELGALDGIARWQVGVVSQALLSAMCEPLTQAEMVAAMASLATLDRLSEGVQRAAELAHRYGGIDGAHHKQWLLDQMLRALLGDEGYRAWRRTYEAETDDGGAPIGPWGEGTPP